MTDIKRSFDLKGIDPLIFLGMNDENLKIIKESFEAKITVRGQTVTINGKPNEVNLIEDLISDLIFHINQSNKLDKRDVETALKLVQSGDPVTHDREELDSVVLFTEKDTIKPRSTGQKDYMDSADKNEIVFAVGPAGTGKTFLAVAVAVQHLKNKKVQRIILARPAVEAGESLGFLPGDFREKIEPYLLPLYDSLNTMLPASRVKKLIENNTVEIIPLAYMRGRTLNNAFVILDEAQNSTVLQMKMFLTRLGPNSRAIITGDITQVDLKDKSQSGLIQIQKVLQNIPGIDFVYLDSEDVVRHRLVKDIIRAYDRFHTENGKNNGNTPKINGKHAE